MGDPGVDHTRQVNMEEACLITDGFLHVDPAI